MWKMSFSEWETMSAWQERALDRSLEPARARSVARLERLLAAARDLANETGNAAFTVTQVTQRAGLSLKSFYRCFAGKDDLLLALIEEDSRIGAAILREAVDAHDDPAARIRAYIIGIFDLLTHPGALGYAGVLVCEERRLAHERPAELQLALAPLWRLLASEISRAVAAAVCASCDPDQDAQTIFALVLCGIHDATLGRVVPREHAEYLWRFCWSGLRGDGPANEPAAAQEASP
jgi:AcrR family transcriptional regulator